MLLCVLMFNFDLIEHFYAGIYFIDKILFMQLWNALLVFFGRELKHQTSDILILFTFQLNTLHTSVCSS